MGDWGLAVQNGWHAAELGAPRHCADRSLSMRCGADQRGAGRMGGTLGARSTGWERVVRGAGADGSWGG